MGSALTVLLGISRIATVSSVISILVKKFGYLPTTDISILFAMLFIGSMLLMQQFEIPLLNYFEYPTPPIIEIILVYIMLYMMYQRSVDPRSQILLIYIGIVYSYFVFVSLNPSADGIDKIAAQNFWKELTF